MIEQKKKRGRPAVLKAERVKMPERYVLDPAEVANKLKDAAESPQKTSRQRALENNKAASQRIELELTEKRPFDPALVSPGCDFALKTALPLAGVENHILHINTRSSPDMLAVFDIESSSLRASVIHHGVLMKFEPGQFITVGINEKPVTRFKSWDDQTALAFTEGHTLLTRTWSEAAESIRGVMRALIDQQTAMGLNRGRAKIYAHSGSRFDWSGLALHLGIDRNFGHKEEIIHDGKKRVLFWHVEDYGSKPRIYLQCGSGGSFKVELMDSNWILNAPLSSLSGETKKGKLPEMFSNPDRWLKAQGFDVPVTELNEYRKQAHIVELNEEGQWVTHHMYSGESMGWSVLPLVSDEHPFGAEITPRAREAITHWKRTLTQRETDYSRNDVIVLANALNRFDQVCQRINIQGPFPFNTSAMVGHAALVQGVYEQSVRKDDYGKDVARFGLPRPRYAYFNSRTMALLPHDASRHLEEHGSLPQKAENELKTAVRNDEEDNDLDGDEQTKKPKETNEEKVVFQHTGIIERVRDVAVVVKNPIYCTKRVNQEFRRVQRGGRCEVFAARNRPGTSMVSIDAKSMYPSTMARGLLLKILIGDERKDCAVLRDYVDPRLLKSSWSHTECGDKKFTGINFESHIEPGQHIQVFTVKGRTSVLRFLQSRGGMFYAKLPQSACEFFRKYPTIPMNTMGSDIDSRLVFPDWKGMLHIYITGEELAYFLSEPTVDDESVEIDLNRSLHAPLMPTNLFGKFVGNVFLARSESGREAEALERQAAEMHDRMLAGESIKREDVDHLHSMSSSKKAEEQILKLVLNSGGYGTLAQQNAPEIDIDVENLRQVVSVLERLRIEDPLWDSVGSHAAKLDKTIRLFLESHIGTPEGATASWEELIESASIAAKLLSPALRVIKSAEEWVTKKGTQHANVDQVIETIRLRSDKADLIGDEVEGNESDSIRHAINTCRLRMKALYECFLGLFQDYAQSHLASCSTYHTQAPSGRKVQHILLTLIDRTADYAIRPWACAITAKARVSLHLAMRAVHEAGADQILYCDTDSVHFSVACSEQQDPAEIAKEMLKSQEFIRIGGQLGQWQIERKQVRSGLAVAGKPERSDFICRNVYYASKKAYVMADAEFNVLDCRARGVTRSDARRQAAFLDYSIRISKLGDRRGIRVDNEAKIDLLKRRKVTSVVVGIDGKPKPVERGICGLFANFTRIYHDQFDSVPTVFDPEKLAFEPGQDVSAKELASAFYEQLPYKAVARGGDEFRGLQIALSDYMRNWKITKEAVNDARASITREIDEIFDKVKAAKGELTFEAELQEALLNEKINEIDLPF